MNDASPRPRTLAEKVWHDHLVVKGEDGEPDLIYIDLHLVHEVTSPQAFDGLRRGAPAAPSDLTIATEDHNTPTLRSTSRSPTSPAARRSRRCAITPRSSASGCTPWATSSRASCTSSDRSWA